MLVRHFQSSHPKYLRSESAMFKWSAWTRIPRRNGSSQGWVFQEMARMYDIDKWIVFVELDKESYVSDLAGPCKSSIDMTSSGHYRRTILSAQGFQEMAENEAHFRDGQPIAARGFTKYVSDIGLQPTADRDQITVFDQIYSTISNTSPHFPGYLGGGIPTPHDIDACPPLPRHRHG